MVSMTELNYCCAAYLRVTEQVAGNDAKLNNGVMANHLKFLKP